MTFKTFSISHILGLTSFARGTDLRPQIVKVYVYKESVFQFYSKLLNKEVEEIFVDVAYHWSMNGSIYFYGKSK